MHKLFKILILSLIVIVFISCQSKNVLSDRTIVQHIVICWLKNPNDVAATQKLISVTNSFSELPGIINISIGRAVPSDRPIVDDSFDITIIMTFENKAALDNYLRHPKHKEAVQEVLQPLTKKVLIYDYHEIQ